MASNGGIEIDLPSTPFSSADSVSDLAVQKIKIHEKTAKELLDICREFNLKASSNRKADLKEAIIKFSENRSLWCTKEHTLSRRRPHKGPRVPPKAKTIILSETRLESHQENVNSPMLSNSTRNLATWARAFVSKQEAATETAASAQSPLHLPHGSPAFSSETLTRLFIQSLNQVFKQQNAPSPPHTEVNSNCAPTDLGPLPSCEVVQVPLPASNAELPLPNTDWAITQTQSVFCITLFQDTLEYTDSKKDFVDPPLSAQVLSDLNQLCEMWDDSSPRWRHRSLVVVRNKPIAFQYLHKYYRNFKLRRRKLWDGFKHDWHTWKILAEEYSPLTEDQFWAKWTKNGRRLPLRRIAQVLQQAKSDEEVKDAQAAKEAYQGKQFEQHFSYFKSGIRIIMTKNCAIAKRYRQLKKQL